MVDSRVDGTDGTPHDEGTEVSILSKGSTICYAVPSFPVYSAKLVDIKVELIEPDGSVHVFDAFARKCDHLIHNLPALALLTYSSKDAFMIVLHNVSAICVFTGCMHLSVAVYLG